MSTPAQVPACATCGKRRQCEAWNCGECYFCCDTHCRCGGLGVCTSCQRAELADQMERRMRELNETLHFRDPSPETVKRKERIEEWLANVDEALQRERLREELHGPEEGEEKKTQKGPISRIRTFFSKKDAPKKGDDVVG